MRNEFVLRLNSRELRIRGLTILRLLLVTLFQLVVVGASVYAQDTVFIKHTQDWTSDSSSYVTDTVIFPTGMMRHILTGTTVLPNTPNQIAARGFGLYLNETSKSDCMNERVNPFSNQNRINSIEANDSSLVVDITIYANCCYDFLCDFSVDSNGVVDLLY